ncbi:MAG: DUF3226 domain-containing protein, partial [Blastocatellia bacterium]
MPHVRPLQLIVEGHDDLFAIVGLVRAHISWPTDKNDAPVWIEVGRSAQEILRHGYLSSILKTHGVRAVGVMLDADENPKGRYQSIRNLCSPLFPQMPDELPSEGLVVDNDEQRLGVWIMPDNSSEGTLENFLRFLVPDDSEPVWVYAIECVQKARAMGSGCRDAHLPKANLYTWLAWQDPPGQNPGHALTGRVLNTHSPHAAAFLNWFRTLYGL